MKEMFSIGELSRLQNISRQTLIFYDRIGLFCPAYTDPRTGYRYYSARQLDDLDTICIMKKIGFSLTEIKDHMKNSTMESSISAFHQQVSVIDKQIKELQMIKSRISHRCQQLENAASLGRERESVSIISMTKQFLFCQKVESSNTLKEISLATKKCYVESFEKHLPVYFLSGVIVPYEKILKGRYIEAEYAFLPIEETDIVQGIKEIPAGQCISTYHTGDYLSIAKAYQRILKYCSDHNIRITSDAYEFAVNDYLSTKDENEFMTRILFCIS